MRYLTLLRLKLIDLLAMRSLMVVLVAVPLALGLIAGSANLANQNPEVRLAIVDQDQTEASASLVGRLQQSGWTVVQADSADAQRQLLRQKIDGIITIETGYSESLTTLEESKISYIQAEGSLVASIVREAVAAAIIPDYSKRAMLAEIEARYAKIGLIPPEDLAEQFVASMAAYAVKEARLKVTYVGSIQTVPTLTFVVSDYSMEVFFLSIYAVLGAITLSRSDLRRRLASTRHGLSLDYATSIIALFLLGLLQILLYTGSMRLLMQSPLRLSEILLLLVYLTVVLGLGQLLSLLEHSLRLYLSLLILLLLSIAGGCFFQLSEKLLSHLGQYTPQGWVLSRLKNYGALPFYVPLLAASAMLLLGFFLQKRRVVSDN